MMRVNPKAVVKLLILLEPILIFLSIRLPWFLFAGTAEYYWATVEVSGWISVIGTGRLDPWGAEVTMWSTTTQWSSRGSDFGLGYLGVVGLILVWVSAILFVKTDRRKSSLSLASIGGLMAVSASLVTVVHYRPGIFITAGYFAFQTRTALGSM